MFELPEKIVFMCSQLLLFCFKARTCQVDRKREEFVRNSVKLIFCRLQVSSGVSLNNSVNINPVPCSHILVTATQRYSLVGVILDLVE